MIRNLLLLFMLCLSGCGAEPPRAPVVLAAASLQEALTEAADAWAAQGHPRPVLSFAASSALARQIEGGAPADLFLSADEEWMDALGAKGLIDPASRASFLGNRLVLIAPAAARTALAVGPGMAIGAALGDGRLAIADPAGVPAGRYAKAALTALGVWRQVAERIAAAENVRAALALVERGEAPLGIVYETDAAASKTVRVVGVFPASSYPPITYPIARLNTASAPDADAFRAYLIGPALPIFRAHGFTAP
ncbi:molybdate ABC transporter substrate-binding protein [Sphingomonas sanxanigenens]|uniref:Molybdenum ABC transporter substrate-binding protein n=1 Tax=Sphingomonas sanxanigenens DSM 19645 = NX02 TaxID=1123269 RepID=W0A8S1_9SPHN|nr:molybdate ABC transporter substrate-binding protein [Sphingomonas sanxanigenens]AHE52892.1 hypothetical protein NX02_05785 [Sphingomonas sanxanigenens DSM 19645 = NX02]